MYFVSIISWFSFFCLIYMTDTKIECNLCGLPVVIFAFSLKTAQDEKIFCCEGCKSIYKLLNEDKLLPDSDTV